MFLRFIGSQQVYNDAGRSNSNWRSNVSCVHVVLSLSLLCFLPLMWGGDGVKPFDVDTNNAFPFLVDSVRGEQ